MLWYGRCACKVKKLYSVSVMGHWEAFRGSRIMQIKSRGGRPQGLSKLIKNLWPTMATVGPRLIFGFGIERGWPRKNQDSGTFGFRWRHLATEPPGKTCLTWMFAVNKNESVQGQFGGPPRFCTVLFHDDINRWHKFPYGLNVDSGNKKTILKINMKINRFWDDGQFLRKLRESHRAVSSEAKIQMSWDIRMTK